MKKLAKKLIVMYLITSMMTVEVLMAASTGYFNTYSIVNSNIGNSTYFSQQGMCIDRFNGDAYYIRKNDNTGKCELVTCKFKTSSTPVALHKKGDSSTVASNIFGHGNDLSVVATTGAAIINIYVAPLNEGTYANRIIKLNVNRIDKTWEVAKVYKLNGGVSVSGITYSVGTKKFLVASKGVYYIGTFNDATGNFDVKTSFTIDKKNAMIDGKKVDCSSYIGQGICFYKSKLYIPLWNGNKINQSVVLVYKLNMNQTSFSTSLTPMSNLSFRITSSKYSKFEIEDVGLCDGILYFNTNSIYQDKNSDLLGSFKNYVAEDI